MQNIPANVNAPFGLFTRHNNAYVTIAHADEIGLVRNGKVQPVPFSDAGKLTMMSLSAWLGRHQTFGTIASRCPAADAECLKTIRDGGEYKQARPDVEGNLARSTPA